MECKQQVPVHLHWMGAGLDDLSRSLPTQTVLWSLSNGTDAKEVAEVRAGGAREGCCLLTTAEDSICLLCF